MILADLIAAGDITLTSVTVQTPQMGSSFVQVAYVNNRATVPTDGSPTVVIPLTSG